MRFHYLLVCVLTTFFLNAQDSTKVKKTNPIVFAEVVLGSAVGNAHGSTWGFTANYQNKKELYTLRFINQTKLNFEGFFLIIPIYNSELNIYELSSMYGRRKIIDNKSLSYSVGLSYNFVDIKNVANTNYFGVPFEMNIKWFKKKKKRFRSYFGLIPIGKPSSFGRSLGFKLYGNIGKFSYVGLGLNYGFGFHKLY